MTAAGILSGSNAPDAMNTPGSERTQEKPRPDAKAILLCDQTITDVNIGKPSLIGIFDNIDTSQFPCAVSISIFLKMTDAQGEYTFRFELIRNNDGQAIAGGQLPGPVVVGDRLAEFNLVWDMYVQFTEPGRYEFQIYEDGRLVAHKAFTVALVQEG